LSLRFRHRRYQLKDLESLVNDAKKPVIVAGDFNVLWGDRELRQFLAATGLKSVNGQGMPSHPSRAPRRQLDYIFFTPELRATGFEVPRVTLSDHIPLICDFEIAAGRSGKCTAEGAPQL